MINTSGVAQREKRKKFFQILRYLLISLGLGLLFTIAVTVLPNLFGITLIPADFRNSALLFILLSAVYFALIMLVRRSRLVKWKKYTVLAVSMLISSIIMVVVVYLANTFIFFQSINGDRFNNKTTYSVVVRSNSSYERITELDGKEMGIMDGKNELNAVGELEKSLELEFALTVLDSGVSELANNLINKNVEAICIEQGRLNFLYDEIEGFRDESKVIYTFKVQEKETEISARKTTSSKPFIVYVSGIDQYGRTDSVTGRSDVNQLIVVNPKTRKILLVNTPRDYYVQLSGTNGLKDKLTHAGIYGIDTSISTMEELYDIGIDYYVRVNFDSLINVVDQIGGIDIDSDQAFRAYTDSSVYVEEGINHFHGKEALAYARERYAYESGDRHRGENQQQVITAIINKISNSSVLLRNYNNILQSLTGSFQTNIPAEMLASFIGDQTDNNTKWQISAISVSGTGANMPTYSMGEGLPLYVMIPDEESLANAKLEINEALDEN